MKDWYVLHVLTGKEQAVTDRLAALEIEAWTPLATIIERRNQQEEEVIKAILPGYVFVQAELSPRLYYNIKSTPSIIRFLGMPTTVPPDEMAPWLAIKATQPFGVSEGERDKESGRTRIRHGPLKPLQDRIVSVDARQRRAKLELKVMGKTITVSVGLKMKGSHGSAADDSSPCDDRDEQIEGEQG